MTSVKALSASDESNVAKTIASKYAYASTTSFEPAASVELQDSIPIVDYALLTSSDPHQRSETILQLGQACEDWGFFKLVNHGVPEPLMRKMMNYSKEFFALPEEKKMKYKGNGRVLDPIKCTSSFVDSDKTKFLLWRDYLRVIAAPQFHFPDQPSGFSELALDYTTRTRIVARELLKGVSKCLGLEELNLSQEMNLDEGFQLFVVNYYPPCPQPEIAIGIPPHTDHGLLTFLYQNEAVGLQVQHEGKWVQVSNDIPNALLVNVGDHLEIFSNGKYKSIKHRAVLNDKVTRITIVNPHGPSLDTTVCPSSRLVDDDGHPPAYRPMKYQEYIESQIKATINGKNLFDQVRINPV